MGGGFKENDGGGRGLVCIWEGAWRDGHALGECLPRAPVRRLHGRAPGGPGRFIMAQAPDSSCALLLSSPQPFTPSDDARVCSPGAPGVFDLHPSLPPPHTAPSPPLPRLSGISAIPPPSAGSEPPKGRLPSSQLQVTNGRKAGLRRLRAKLGAARREPLPQCAPLGAPPAEPLRGG